MADIVVSQKAGDGQKTEQNGEDDPDIDEVHFSLTPCRENLAPIAGRAFTEQAGLDIGRQGHVMT